MQLMKKNIHCCALFGFAALLLVNANPFGSPDDDGDDNGDDMSVGIFTWLSRFGYPLPPPPFRRFFLGSFESDPAKDWQLNMYNTYKCLDIKAEMSVKNVIGQPSTTIELISGVPPEVLNMDNRISITQKDKNVYHYFETMDNSTVVDFDFELGVSIPTKIHGEDFDCTIDVRGPDRLVIKYNNTAAGNVKVVFDYNGRDKGFDALFWCYGNAESGSDDDTSKVVKGIRRFHRQRRDD